MKLSCPCNREIEAVIENGIIAYKHTEDGSLCGILNNFYQDKVAMYAGQRCIRAAKKRTAKNFRIFNEFCLTSSNEIISYMFAYIEKMDVTELNNFFSFLFSGYISNKIVDSLCTKMVSTFGETALDNIRVYDEFYTKKTNTLMPLKGTERKMAKLEVLKKIKSLDVKQDIISDLAKSFMIDSAIKTGKLDKALRNIGKRL